MSYYFKFYKAMPKRRATVGELAALLKIEEATRDAFDELAQENKRKNTALYLSYWKQWQKYCSAWSNRIQSIREDDYSLALLDAHEKITIEEAFCILMGITPDSLDELGFLNWRLSEVPRFLRVYKEEQTPLESDGIMPSFLNIEQHLRGTKEYKKLVREFGEPSDEETLAGEFERIDTQAFIEWALKLGYIVPNEPHLYANNKPPYHPDFARMLHSLLTKHKVIDGEFESKWKWLGRENSLAYLVELLHQNGLPYQWHADNSFRTTINWTNILHYVDYKGESPLRKNAQYGKSGVKFKSELNQTIDSLLIDYEGWKNGRRDEFLELE